jgi:hypothetical protein
LSDDTVRASLDALLAARESGIRYAESRLNSLALVSGGFIAAGIALLSIGIGESSDITRPTLIASALALLAVAVGLLVVYVRSTNPQYPFIDDRTDLKKARWKWFYWDALPEPLKFANLSWSGRLRKAARLLEVNEVDRQWPIFRERLLDGLRDDEQNLEEDLRQLYTLHINERYKNAYLSKERSVLKLGLAFVLLATASVGVTANCVQSPVTSYRVANGRLASGVRYVERWTEVSRGGGEVRMALHLTLHNPNSVTYTYTAVEARDQDGFALPVNHRRLSIRLVGSSHVSRTISIDVPRSYARAIATFEVS